MSHVIAKNVVVEFPVYAGKSLSFKSTLIRAATGGRMARDASDRVVIRAVDNLSFELREGDRVGIVGHNGSGKSTLLRTIAGAYEPVSGSMEVSGRFATMLSIWLGMDLEATGYENIFLRATVMGLRRAEIEPLADEICAFSELGDYLHMPLRTYSSGMAMRLAFATSTGFPADIILMDEWMSVGDTDFSQKAQDRLRKMIDQAKILVLASHDDALVKKNCNRIMRLDHGKMVEMTERCN
jgi:lipopolysaccharide transport system ATP-binding protein